jgi:hypothetical protein
MPVHQQQQQQPEATVVLMAATQPVGSIMADSTALYIPQHDPIT